MEHLEDKKRKAVARAFFKGSAAIVMEIWLKFFLDDEKKNYYQTKQKKYFFFFVFVLLHHPPKKRNNDSPIYNVRVIFITSKYYNIRFVVCSVTLLSLHCTTATNTAV